MDRDRLLKIFRQTNALLRGHFELSSGLHSGHYFQCALFLQHPTYAASVCRELALRFKRQRPQVIVGLAVGGVIVAFEVARHLKVRSIFTEREKDVMLFRRGFDLAKGERVVVVEDVITTGDSIREVITLCRRAGAKVTGIGTIVDRSGGQAKFGRMPLESLISLRMESFKPQQCPLCKEGWPLVKPGSRHEILML